MSGPGLREKGSHGAVVSLGFSPICAGFGVLTGGDQTIVVIGKLQETIEALPPREKTSRAHSC